MSERVGGFHLPTIALITHYTVYKSNRAGESVESEQARLEAEMMNEGEARAVKARAGRLQAMESAKARHYEENTEYGRDMVERCAQDTEQRLRAWIEDQASKQVSWRHRSFHFLRELCQSTSSTPEAGDYLSNVALGALREVVSSISTDRSLVNLMVQLGQDALYHPPLIFSDSHQATPADEMHVGATLWNAILPSGLVERVLIPHPERRWQTKSVVRATPLATAWREAISSGGEASQPFYMPSIDPPKPWTGMHDGGYPGGVLRRIPFIKPSQENCRNNVPYKTVELVTTMRAVNLIQETSWRINGRILEVAKSLHPDDIEAKLTLGISERLANKSAIYFPHQVDFRGRCYPLPVILQPQGDDLARGLLTFANGKNLQNTAAINWLAIHGANCYGVDKVSLVDRVRWTHDNAGMIQAVAADPISCREWEKADDGDKRWQFLAFCFEWAEYLKTGPSFVSTLPVSVDGSCNGLQHLSAMARSEVEGRAVNLCQGDRQDLYQTIASKLSDIARADPILSKVDPGVFSRRLAKKPVMTLVYGASQFSYLEWIRNYLKDRAFTDEQLGLQGAKNKDKARRNLIVRIQRALVTVMKATVRDAAGTMKWIQGCAKKHNDRLLGISWTTPTGFRVTQDYSMMKCAVYKPPHTPAIRYLQPTDRLDKRAQIRGIVPNFVHSMDASALMMTTVRAHQRGVAHFAMVHDSYGTLAADMDTLATTLREAFVEMYTTHDVLSELRDATVRATGCETFETPRGSLDLNEVLGSEFFFA